MMDLIIKKTFHLSTLFVAITCATSSLYAFEELEKLDDYELGEATGEGIAFLPENFSIKFNGADNTNSGQGTENAGYIHLIPVGPLSTTTTNKGYQKADIWLYGTSLSQSNTNLGTTISAADWGTSNGRNINSWGSASNPWVLKATTDPDVPNFAGDIKSVTNLRFEAPLYHTIVPTSGAEASAYNLKLGFWADAFQRNASLAETPTFNSNELSNRLRLNFVWDSFSINGSNVSVFQTLDGVSSTNNNVGGTYTASLLMNGVNTSKTFNYGLSTSYNKTLGLAGLARLNSGPTDTRRGTVSNNTGVTRQIIQMNYNPVTKLYTEGAVLASATNNNLINTTNAVANSDSGITVTYMPMTNGGRAGDATSWGKFYSGTFNNGGVCTSPKALTNSSTAKSNGQCTTSEGFTTRRFKAFGTNTWTPPTARSVIRLSTQEKSGGTYDASTPALGGLVPNFSPNAAAEGIFLYDPNFNLVLGSLHQPLMFSTDGNNFAVELARIPNSQEVYKRIYQRYAGDTGDASITYSGSTCNVYQCGVSDIDGYQGSSATHSSISIGSTEYTKATNQLSAHKGIGAYGISIGELKAGDGIASDLSADYTQVWRRTRSTTSTSGSNWGTWGSWSTVAPKNPIVSSIHPSFNRPDPTETVHLQNYNGQKLGLQTTMPTNINNAINGMVPTGGTVSNNLGSAVIDGLLIQHLKISTTGL